MRPSIARWAVALWLVVAGCVPDGLNDVDWKALQPPAPEPEPALDWVEVGTATTGTVAVALDVFGAATAGPVPVRLRLTDTRANARIDEARLTLTATEPATGRTLPPIDAPAQQADAHGAFATTLLLLPSQPDAEAELTVAFDAGDGRSGTVVFTVPMPSGDRARVLADGAYLVWMAPDQPVTGPNDLAFALYAPTASGWQMVDTAALTLYPWMDMGGGDGHSAPYQNPTPQADGRYVGRVDFIMSGGWDLTVTVTRATAEAVAFEGFTVEER